MPDGDGLYLLNAIAADEGLLRRSACVCMAVSRFSRLPVALVSKPFDIDALVGEVADAHRRLLARLGAPGPSCSPTWGSSAL